MAKALAAARLGFRRLFSISAFTPPPAATPPPKADPSTNLFVSGLSKRTTSEGLREAFSKFGEVVQARVVTDRVSGYSKGFGFVRYVSIEDASEGIKGMDGKFLDGWVIFAEYARPRPPLSQDQSSQPQPNYGSAPQSNYSYYNNTSAATSNYSSQPPLTNSYYTSQTSQPHQSYGGSVPPSNYESVQSQQSAYFNHSSPTSQPPPSNAPPTPASNYESVQSQSSYASTYFNRSPQTSQPPPSNAPQSQSGYASGYFNNSNGSAPPFNYSSELTQPSSNSSATPSWYSSQTTQASNYFSGAPSYTQSHHGSAPASNHSSQAPQTSDPSSGYNSTPQNSSLMSENPQSYASPRNSEAFEASSDYEPGRAANY